jgi:hypothetical protein
MKPKRFSHVFFQAAFLTAASSQAQLTWDANGTGAPTVNFFSDLIVN